jgi:HlyD family secretion protein
VDKRWIIRRLIVLAISLCGIIIAITIPSDPNRIISESTNMIAPPPINPFQNAVCATAITEANGNDIRIGSAVNGLIEDVYVKPWDKVEEGQPLLCIDTRQIRAQIEVDRQDIKVRQAEVNTLEIQYQRYLSVDDQRAISEESISTKLTELQTARAQLDRAYAQLAADEVDLDRHYLRAPCNAVILRNTFLKGMYFGGFEGTVLSSANTTITDTPFEMVLGPLDYIQLRVDVDEQNACRIIPNKRAIGIPREVIRTSFELEFVAIEPFIVPKKSLTGNSDERIDTRVLQVVYRFKPDPSYQIYIGQMFDVYIEAHPLPTYQPIPQRAA